MIVVDTGPLVIVAAEALGTRRVFTLDRADFNTYRFAAVIDTMRLK